MFLRIKNYIPSLDLASLYVKNIGEPDASHVKLIVRFMKIGMIGAVTFLFPLMMALVRAR